MIKKIFVFFIVLVLFFSNFSYAENNTNIILEETETYSISLASDDTFTINFDYDGNHYTLENVPSVSKKFIIQKWDYNGWWIICFLPDSSEGLIYEGGNYIYPYDKNGNKLNPIVTYKYSFNNLKEPILLSNNPRLDMNWFTYCVTSSVKFVDFIDFDCNFIEKYNMYQIVSKFVIQSKRKDKISAQISIDGNHFTDMNFEYADPENSTFMFYFDIDENGHYYVKVYDSEYEKEYNFEFDCTEIDENYGKLGLHLSTTEPTTEPIYILSNIYYYTGDYDPKNDFLNNYDLDVSYGYEEVYGYSPLSVKGYDEEKQMNYCQYQFKVIVNGVYKFKIFNFETQEITYQTFVVRNIGLDNQYGDDIYYDNYDPDGTFNPTPVLFLEYVDSMTVRIRTQPFSFNELIMLQCFTKFEDENFKQNRNIYSYTVDTGNTIYDDVGDELIKDDTIELSYFYLDVQVDGNYTFQFYNLETKKYTEASINVNIRDFITDNIDNIDKFSDKMIAWCKLHFGFLTYPFEVAVNIFGRTMNINYEEPVIHIPELKDPVTHTTFFEGVNYNFNEAVNINNTTRTIYDIYLIIVDVILIFLFVNLLKKVFEGVFK